MKNVNYIELARLSEAVIKNGRKEDIQAVVAWSEKNGDLFWDRNKYLFPEFSVEPISNDEDEIIDYKLTFYRCGEFNVSDWKYEYEYLRGKALYTKEEADIRNLFYWFEAYGDRYWTDGGECGYYDADGYELHPEYEYEYDEEGEIIDQKLVSVELW